MSAKRAYYVAQFNWGVLIDDWDTPTVAEFQDNLDRVNALAMRSPGYVWHMPSDEMEASQMDPDGSLGGNPRLASTLSVWQDCAALDHFVHKSLHNAFLKRSAEWFEKPTGPRHVIWPIEVGQKPTLTEAVSRLKKLGDNGPSSEAYDFNWARENAQRSASHVH